MKARPPKKTSAARATTRQSTSSTSPAEVSEIAAGVTAAPDARPPSRPPSWLAALGNPRASLDFDPELAGPDSLGLVGGGGKGAGDHSRDGSDDDSNVDVDAEAQGLKSTGREHYLDVGVGKIRSQVGNNLADDPKYAGRRVDRSELFEYDSGMGVDDLSQNSDEGSEPSDEEVDSQDDRSGATKRAPGKTGQRHELQDMDESEEESEEESEGSAGGVSDEDGFEEGDNVAKVESELKRLEREESKMLKSFSNSAHEDVEKGLHSFWESLLEVRMDLQKPLTAANLLPLPAVHPLFVSGESSEDAKHAVSRATQQVVGVIDSLLSLQKSLLSQNAGTSSLVSATELTPNLTSRKRKRDDAGQDRDDGTELGTLRPEDLRSIWEDVDSLHGGLRAYRDATVEKWNAKINAAAQGVMAQKKFKAVDQSVLTQIRAVLRDKERLVRRTQLVRLAAEANGKMPRRVADVPFEERLKASGDAAAAAADSTADADRKQEPKAGRNTAADSHLAIYDPEIFDDGDFYQLLLKELIEHRVTDS
ncbi:hypothetical protein HK405_014369, partial [Cladochytrium tenue]